MAEKELTIRFLKENCWKCGYEYYIYYIMPEENKGDIVNKLIFNEKVISKVNEWVKANNNRINIGVIKNRYSNTVGDSYMSFGCPKCDAIYGDFYLLEAIIDTMYEKHFYIDDIKIKIEV